MGASDKLGDIAHDVARTAGPTCLHHIRNIGKSRPSQFGKTSSIEYSNVAGARLCTYKSIFQGALIIFLKKILTLEKNNTSKFR